MMEKNSIGWQKQPDKLNIQGTIEKAIERITGEQVDLMASGRTDRGVHALGQVANFKTNSNIPIDKFAIAINSRLKKSIVIKKAEEKKEPVKVIKAEKKQEPFVNKKGEYAGTFKASQIVSPIYGVKKNDDINENFIDLEEFKLDETKSEEERENEFLGNLKTFRNNLD